MANYIVLKDKCGSGTKDILNNYARAYICVSEWQVVKGKCDLLLAKWRCAKLFREI